MFPANTLAPFLPACGTVREGLALEWHMALDPLALRQTFAKQTGPCTLVTWSLGALAALRLALDPPPCLRALVLLGATARLPADPRSGYPGVPPATLAAMRRRLRRDPSGLFAAFHALCASPLTPVPAETAAFVAGALAQDQELADRGLVALATLDLRDLAASVLLPTTLVHGEEDAVVPLAQARLLAAALPHATLVAVPGGGHLPTAETARALAAATGKATRA